MSDNKIRASYEDITDREEQQNIKYNIEEVKNKIMKIIVVSGGFDPIHSGHIAYFESAKARR